MEKRKRAKAPTRPKASSAEVLGQGAKLQSIPAKWRQHYRRLLELRETLAKRHLELSQDALEEQPSFSMHMADAGTDTYDRDLALGMLSSEQDAAYQIEQAMDRIRNRTYGICEITGKPIEAARLEVIPWTRFSVAASRQLERRGAFKHTRLGQRDSVMRTLPEAEVDTEPEEIS
jgi:DnaK suppressor protein